MKKSIRRSLFRYFIILLTCMTCLQVAAPGLRASAEATEFQTVAYMSEDHAPVFYGTTAIKVPVGTKVDFRHDARFRIFAKDNEDFDLTDSIQVESEDVDTSEAGHYEICYRVTDNDGNTVSLTVPVDVEEDGTEIWLEKTMYTLPSVDHLNELGYYRGNYMDRQIIGLFLDEDEEGNVGTFEMRKISGAGNLSVMLQNNNGYCESTKTVMGQYDQDGDEGWQRIWNTGASDQPHDGTMAAVPTINTLYKETGPVVYEIRYDVSDELVQPLHYYHEGDGFAYETRFLEEWEQDTDSFAVVDGVSLMALLPYEDRKLVYRQDQRSFNSFDEMLAYWTEICDRYDALIGISYTPDVYWNQAVKTKYFIRANKHGAGSAYYSYPDCVGKNSTSMYSLLHPWWGTLHEYGHGYQGNLGSSGYGMPITEVAVNIFSYYIQELSGLYPVNEHWIGNIDEKEEEWNRKRKENILFTDVSIGSDTTLYALINVLNTFEYTEAYAHINQYYREVYFTTGKRLQTQDAWILALEEKYNVNLVPYFESWGIQVSEEVKDRMMLSDAEVLYYMGDMIEDHDLAAELKKQYGHKGEYDLVTAKELSETGLTGTVEFHFDIADFSIIRDKYLYINNGGEQIAKVKVTEQTMTLVLPAGAYKVAPPRGKVGVEYDQFYITVVGGGSAAYEVRYREHEKGISSGNDVIIYARGYWSETAHPFTVQVVGSEMQFRYQDTYPNSGGTADNAVFSSLTLYDDEGLQIYEKSVNGGWYDTFVDDGVTQVSFDVKPGYRLRVYYRGPQSDMRYVSQLSQKAVEGYELDHETCAQTYVVTEYGLIPERFANDQEELYRRYQERVYAYLDQLLAENKDAKLHDPFANSKFSNQIDALLALLTPEDQKAYVGTFTNGQPPVISFKQPDYVYEVDTFDLETFKQEIQITDLEEGAIDVDSDEVQIFSDVDAAHPGEYTVAVEVTDREENVSAEEVRVSVIDMSHGEQDSGEQVGERPAVPEQQGSAGNSEEADTPEEEENPNHGTAEDLPQNEGAHEAVDHSRESETAAGKAELPAESNASSDTPPMTGESSHAAIWILFFAAALFAYAVQRSRKYDA